MRTEIIEPDYSIIVAVLEERQEMAREVLKHFRKDLYSGEDEEVKPINGLENWEKRLIEEALQSKIDSLEVLIEDSERRIH